MQARELEQVLPDVPLVVLEHPLAPLGAEPLHRLQHEACSAARSLQLRAVQARASQCQAPNELVRLFRLEPVCRERHVREQRAARPENARALREAAIGVDVDEHVAAPDPVERRVLERKLLERPFDDVDLVRQACVGDALAGEHAMQRQRIERYRPNAVLADEPDRMDGVARACIEDAIGTLRTEPCEDLEQPVRPARVEALCEGLAQLGVAGPDLVELLNGRRQPPAMAGSKITVEASPTGVSSPSRVRTSSPSTYTFTNGAMPPLSRIRAASAG